MLAAEPSEPEVAPGAETVMVFTSPPAAVVSLTTLPEVVVSVELVWNHELAMKTPALIGSGRYSLQRGGDRRAGRTGCRRSRDGLSLL